MENTNMHIGNILKELPCYNLELYLEIANEAFSNGEDEKAILWFSKGLRMAHQLKNELKIKEFSDLIMAAL